MLSEDGLKYLKLFQVLMQILVVFLPLVFGGGQFSVVMGQFLEEVSGLGPIVLDHHAHLVSE